MKNTGFACQILITLEFYLPIFEKYSNIIYHEDPSAGSRFIPCGRTDTTKLVVAVRSFTSASLKRFNLLNPELNPICSLLALLAHHFLHVSRIRVKSLTLRLLMSYIYIYIYIWSAYS